MTSYNKLPKTLERIDPKIISINAKYIYTLMLDRYNLSQKNQWIDADGNIYLYFTLFDVQKAIGVSEKTAIKVLKELENNGLIIRKRQGQGNPARTYLSDPELEHTKINNTVNNTEKHNKCKKNTCETKPKVEKCQDNTSDQKQEKEEKNPEVTEIIETFERFIGRKPDKSFRKTIAKRLKTGLDIKIIKAAIEKAYKTQAKKPEAFILYLTQHNQNLTQYKQTENTVEQERTQQQTDKPLEEWELEWLLEVAKYQQDKEKIDQCNKLLNEFSKQRLEKQITDMLANS